MKENYRQYTEIGLNQNRVAGKVFILESTDLLENKNEDHTVHHNPAHSS